MCQVKVGNNLQNCHNAQNQNIKSEKGLQKEICFNHFIFEGIGIFLTGSKPLPSVFGVLAADKGGFELLHSLITLVSETSLTE